MHVIEIWIWEVENKELQNKEGQFRSTKTPTSTKDSLFDRYFAYK